MKLNIHNYNYEVMFSFNFYDTGDICGLIYIWSDIFGNSNNNWYLAQGNTHARHNSFIFTMPIKNKVFFKLTDENSKNNFFCVGYRRIGSNS